MTSTITSNLNNVSDEVIAHSTTKALMLCITVPRVYRVYVPPKTTVVAAAAEDGTALSITPTQNNEPPSSGNTACSNNAEEAKSEGEQVVAEEKAVVEEKVEEKVVIEEKVIIVNIPESPEIKVGRKKVGGKTEAENENASKIEENGENDEDHDDKIEEEDSMTEVGYVEEHSHREGVPVVDHVVTQEEMATIVKIDPNARDEDAASGDENSKGAINETAESTEDGATKSVEESVVSKAMKLFYGVAGLKRDDPIYMSRDEAVAAMKGFESFKKESEDSTAPNTEIRVEALVRLTFRNLRSEGHFYNAPIYTGVESPKKDGEGVDEWIELTVMVKDASIGIILERLERIGVGSTVGSISIYKAELCRAADLVSPNPISVSTRGESKDQKEGEDGVTGNPKIEAARMAWKNAASRLRVEQVKEQIHEQAVMSFDFLALLTIASILAGIGLITDSTVVIVASMLVSPIMVSW